ncbi:MAG: polysaccharide pyruvyl transferase family protein [Saprospiraceae bacterium]
MKYGLLIYDYNYPTYNIGDYIQSLAVKQFLPEDVIYVNREELKDYNGDDVKIILNGWFLHNIDQWPPSAKINPLFISFHLNILAKSLLESKENINYFRKYNPIGCRDKFTQELLADAGIQTYLSNCVTLTLGKSYKRNEGHEILFVDVFPKMYRRKVLILELLKQIRVGSLKNILLKFKTLIFKYKKASYRDELLKSLFDESILKLKIEIEHDCFDENNHDRRFQKADNFLKRYSTAKVVFTSKIHCALPCLAIGTPVIFIKGQDLNNEIDECRFSEILNLLNVVSIDVDNNITCNYSSKFCKLNLTNFPLNKQINKNLVEDLISNIESFIRN